MKSTIFRNALTTLTATVVFSSIAIGSHANLAMAGSSVDSLRIGNLSQFSNDEEEDEDSSPQAASNKKLSVQYYNRGLKAQEKGDIDAAFELYAQSLKLDPMNGHAWLVVGSTLCEQGKIKLGIKALKISVQVLEMQGDSECHDMAISLLQKYGVEE
jgi:tetratricopeptide (TPR) repeat protein